MRELVEYMVKALVDNPDQVTVHAVDGEVSTIFEVRVAPEDMGKIIGRQGRIANALRTIVKAAAMKSKRKVSVEIIS